ncbi:bifunctional (p)ppGpp synthetase/guanosine-3',5'-bis(diphosphate) 3'-pyrophosphohydrolase [bacterium]|nr:bifunctional (p)ppGpp synthetase/guanosine-3',5'-bis(diphosphate) 3'-pyrophosphohydrolase [bacterium]
MKLQDVISAVQGYLPNPDIELIHRAYAFVRHHHQGQTRASGEPYVTHVTEVAFLATKLRLDTASIVTALLHDTVEDTSVTLQEVEQQFGQDVAQLVDGVTKLSQVNFSSREEAQAENFRKMLLAMSKDIRVLLVKLCDRTHNMRTLEFLSEARRLRIAQETIDIYAPLAHRLGIYWMKSELEDLSLRHLHPNQYEIIKQSVATKKRERDLYIEEVVRLISTELEQNNIQGKVSGRSKNFYSIYQKMERSGVVFDEIYDLTAFRIIVGTTMDCYAALGAIHAAWKPIPGRFKDYIAMPKPNGYQSLHTSVIGPRAARIEIQIRTEGMHNVAESGIAAHWVYKEEGETAQLGQEGQQFTWIKELVESGSLLRDPKEFMSTVKAELFQHEVFVFTPKGDVYALQAGATPIDFAYAIHSEVGNHCTGARINGQQVALDYKLKNGDAVEIQTTTKQVPNKDWLNLAVTTRAKQRIRAWLKAEERKRAISVGNEVLAKDLQRMKSTLPKVQKSGELLKAAKDLGYSDEEMMLTDIGYGKLTTTEVIAKLFPEETNLEEKLKQETTILQKIFQKAARSLKDKSGIKVSGFEDMVFHFAQCCEPLPGDPLVGYISRGRGVVIHTRNCPQATALDQQRLIEVAWDDQAQAIRSVKLMVRCRDRLGILAEITQAIASQGANIVTASLKTRADGSSLGEFEISISGATQLEAVVKTLEKIDGVMSVERKRRAQA